MSDPPQLGPPNVEGDSTSTEARVALVDAKARVKHRTAESLACFEDVLLAPIQAVLLEFTWLTERHTCDGKRERTPFFFEYVGKH